MKLRTNAEYKIFVKEIKQRVLDSQYAAFRAVNKELVVLYWDIGKKIVDRQNKLGWGKAVVENLAFDLQKEFPGIRGFSVDNLWRMRKFFLQFANNTKLAPLVQEISWAKIIVIMESCKDDADMEFYINMTKKFGWTKDVLIHQIENQSYEKMLLNQTNFDKAVSAKIRNQAKLAVKDEYTFDFLELGDEHLESELERALMANVRRFLLEMGGHFCFVGNQHRIEIDGREYFVDILLYHRKLRCLVAIELLCGAPHNIFCVALPVMWRSADMHELYHNLYNNGDKTGHHIINRIREPVRNSSDLGRLVDEPFFLFDALRKEQGLLLSFRDRFQHKCWLC